jgi:tetratricopeptide (TPR) repeat protein
VRLLDGALAKARPTAAPGQLASAVLARGQAHRLLGAWQRARADFEDGLALARDAADPTLAALGHMRLGELVETDGATQEARARFTTALACLAAVAGDPLGPLHEADVRTRLAHAYRREGELEHAEREIRRALELHRAAAHSDDLPMVLYEAGVIAWFRGRYDEALARYDEGLALVEATDHARGALLYVRAILLQERGELDAAFDHYVRALEPIRAGGNLYLEASALYYFAGAHLERGQRDDAARLLERALAMVRELGVPRYQALIESCRATLFAVAGDLESARRCLEVAEQAAAACRSERALAATVAIHGLYVRAAAEPAAGPGLLAEARALAEAHPSDDSRFALRAALVCFGRGGAGGEPLIVRAGGRALRLPGAATDVDLSRRVPLQRIVLALARRRIEAPGEALAPWELLAAGWPGERVGDSAGTNRVHVALSTLRNLGLRGLLVSGQGGYALTSASPCVLEPGE